MKRLGIVATAIVLMMLLQTVTIFASGIQVVETHPRDGGRVFPMNFAIRITFDQDVSGARDIYENQEHFIITDEEYNRKPVAVLFDPRNPETVLVVLEEDLPTDTHFTLTISGDFTSGGGRVLGDDYVMRFATRDVGRDMNTSMILMFGALIVMMIVSARQIKKKAQQEAEEKDKNAARVNPYKVSKKTGKSVAQIVEKDRKQKSKLAAEEAKKKAEETYYFDEDEEEDEIVEYSDNYRVSGPKTISKFSTYKSGKKAKAEAEARKKAAAGTTKPKHQTGKVKNKRKK